MKISKANKKRSGNKFPGGKTKVSSGLKKAGPAQKVAVSSNGKDENSDISEVSGRAPYYLIFEGEKLVKTIKNPFAVGGGGAGFAVAKMLENEKVNLVISGRFGPNMQNALKTAGIKFKEVTGKKVKEAI